jgi:hypothetical protein
MHLLLAVCVWPLPSPCGALVRLVIIAYFTFFSESFFVQYGPHYDFNRVAPLATKWPGGRTMQRSAYVAF